MTFFDVLLNVLLSAAETSILFFLYKAFLHRLPEFSNTAYGIGLIGYFIFQLVTYVIGSPLFSTAPYYVVFTILIAMIFFEDSSLIKIITAYLFVVLNYACKLVAATVMANVYSLDLPEIPFELVLIPESQILACALVVIFTILIISCRDLRAKHKDGVYSIISYSMPIGVLALIVHQFTLVANQNIVYKYLDAAGILFLNALFMFFLIDKTVIIDETSRKNGVIAQLLDMQQQYYKSIEVSQKEISSIRHDIKNHLQMIVYMLDQKEYDNAKSYINKLYTITNKLSAPLYSGNNMVDIILNKIIIIAKNKDIVLDMNVMLPKNIPIEDTDVCIILGNLLDNAVEACDRMGKDEHKKIEILITKKKGYIFIKISNTFNGEVHIVNSIYESVKKGIRFCGIGLSNIKNVVDKYEGIMNIKHQNNIFEVGILIPYMPPCDV